MRRHLNFLIPIFLIAVLAVAGCTAGASDDGTVVGSFMQVGGPGRVVDGQTVSNTLPLPGQVVARKEGGSVFTVAVGDTGHFRMLLPPGTYRLTGYSPLYPGPCAGERIIKVRTGREVTHANVICVAA